MASHRPLLPRWSLCRWRPTVRAALCAWLVVGGGGCTRGITEGVTSPKFAGIYQYVATLPGPTGGTVWRGIMVIADTPGDSLSGTLVLPGQCLDAHDRVIDCLGVVSGHHLGRSVSWSVTVPALQQAGEVDPTGTWTGLWTMRVADREWRGPFQAIPLH